MTSTSKKKHESQERKKIDQVKKSVRRIEGMPPNLWISITIFYVIFVAVLSGWVKSEFSDLVYLFGVIPFDTQYGIWALGLALWIPFSQIFAGLYKQRNR